MKKDDKIHELQNEIFKLKSELFKMQSKLDKAIKALEEYSNKENYRKQDNEDNSWFYRDCDCNDLGDKLARQTCTTNTKRNQRRK